MEFKNNEKIEGKKIKVIRIEADMDYQNKDKISKLKFITEDFAISYKPKLVKEETVYGIKTKTRDSCTMEDMPTLLKRIGSTVNEQGYAYILANYMKGDVDQDGATITYRWVQGEKMFDSWKLMDTTTNEETIKG